MRHSIIIILTALCVTNSIAQNVNWKSKLGFTEDDKLLIIHGDDLAVTHSVNKASFEGFQKGLMNSASIMMPCPWYEEVREFSEKNPEFCLGLHLTLTAEWKHLKWQGLADQSETAGLYNEQDYLYSSVAPVIANATVEEVEKEIRAQIKKAISSGLNPSHLDSHMGTLFAKEEFTTLLIRLGEEYKIPVFLPAQVLAAFPNIKDKLTENSVITKTVIMNNDKLEKKAAFAFYDETIANLPAGLNELIVHLGLDNEELKATCIAHPAFGASWRQHDLDYILSPHLESLLENNEIKLVSWKEIQSAIYGN
jgi:predicted glycoside hydrolase/deacetylase ChbG (UPF0249 family)